ncbi:MAG: response regulator [Myxococcota bacterium]
MNTGRAAGLSTMNQIRVLVVDDEEKDFLLTRDLLEIIGGRRYRVEWAPSAEVALTLLEARNHDVCLLDYQLQDRTGLELLRTVRERGVELPIIMMTGRGDHEVDLAAMAAGADDYLVKGQSHPELIERSIRYAIARAVERERRKESQRLFRMVFDTSQDAMLVADDEGRYVEVNLAACRLLGLEREELLEQRLDRFVDGPPEETRRLWQQLLREGRQEGEMVLRRPDGETRVAEYRAVANILPHRHLSVLRDVTERKQMQSRLLLADRMASVGTLAAGVAHEINNPLAYVVANLIFVSERLDEARQGTTTLAPGDLQEMGDAVAEARHGAERIAGIVSGMKALSRVDENREAPVDVMAVLEASIKMAWNVIKHRATLRRELSPVPLVRADEGRLGQVFLNLLINAAHAIPEGATAAEVVVVTRTDESGRAVVEVRDTGVGIPPEVLPRIFDPFFTTKPIGVGTGLGLSICHGIITALGGEITVRSRPGEGSTFSVMIPPALAEQGAAAAQATEPLPERRGRVLVVDDEAMVCTAVGRTLGREHDVMGCTTAEDALQRLRAGERYDVILVDLMMPGKSGMALHEEVMALDPDQAARMVFMTGGAFSAPAREFLERVGNPRLNKPFDAPRLRALVRSRLR